ncbi:hypothetical protein ACOME3_004211 [Neoechinorhynchus agilis]
MNNMTGKLSVRDVDLENKRVMIRVDYNVPLDEQGNVTDATRITETLETISLVKSKNPRCIVLVSHLGRPKGRDEKQSLLPAAKILARNLKERVTFINDCKGPCVVKNVSQVTNGGVIVLENLRFYPEEEMAMLDDGGEPNEDVLTFRRELTSLCDVYINDAFGTAHRAHSSIVGIDVPSRAMGLLMEKELEALGTLTTNPAKPFLAIIGGSKVSDKTKLLWNLIEKVDSIVIAGGMTFTFLKVLQNTKIGSSLYDEEGANEVESIMKVAIERNVEVYLPEDFNCSKSADGTEVEGVVVFNAQDGIQEGYAGMDIGPKSVEKIKSMIESAKTVLWNGPVGVFEKDEFASGTKELMVTLAEATTRGLISVIGGGDTGAAAAKFGFKSKFSHVSTGGGASLEFLEGKELPGIAALTDVTEAARKSKVASIRQSSAIKGSVPTENTERISSSIASADNSKPSAAQLEETPQEVNVEKFKSENVDDRLSGKAVGSIAVDSSIKKDLNLGNSELDKKPDERLPTKIFSEFTKSSINDKNKIRTEASKVAGEKAAKEQVEQSSVKMNSTMMDPNAVENATEEPLSLEREQPKPLSTKANENSALENEMTQDKPMNSQPAMEGGLTTVNKNPTITGEKSLKLSEKSGVVPQNAFGQDKLTDDQSAIQKELSHKKSVGTSDDPIDTIEGNAESNEKNETFQNRKTDLKDDKGLFEEKQKPEETTIGMENAQPKEGLEIKEDNVENNDRTALKQDELNTADPIASQEKEPATKKSNTSELKNENQDKVADMDASTDTQKENDKKLPSKYIRPGSIKSPLDDAIALEESQMPPDES